LAWLHFCCKLIMPSIGAWAWLKHSPTLSQPLLNRHQDPLTGISHVKYCRTGVVARPAALNEMIIPVLLRWKDHKRDYICFGKRRGSTTLRRIPTANCYRNFGRSRWNGFRRISLCRSRTSPYQVPREHKRLEYRIYEERYKTRDWKDASTNQGGMVNAIGSSCWIYRLDCFFNLLLFGRRGYPCFKYINKRLISDWEL